MARPNNELNFIFPSLDQRTGLLTQNDGDVRYVRIAAIRSELAGRIDAIEEASHEGFFVWNAGDVSNTLIAASVTTTAVNATTDTITAAAHGLQTGNAGIMSAAVDGLALNTRYWVIKVAADTFKLAATFAAAVAGTAIDLTGTTNFTFRRLLDPEQNISVTEAGAALDGSEGAWLRSAAIPTGGGWTEDDPPGRIHRLNDRLMVGPGATGWDGRHQAVGGNGSWMMDEGGSVPSMAYLLVNAVIAGVCGGGTADPPYAVLGASKTPGGENNAGVIGLSGYAAGHATAGTSVAWAGYIEAVKHSGSNTTAEGLEVEVTNADATVAISNLPYSVYAQGRTYGLLIGSGGGNIHSPLYDASTAIQIFENGAAFRNGIVLRDNALTADVTTGYKHALLLSEKSRIEWYHSGNAVSFAMHSEVSDTTHQQSMVVLDTGIGFYNQTGFQHFDIAWVADAVNRIRVIPRATGSSPAVASAGQDTDLDLLLLPKGTGVVQFGTRSAIAAETVTGYITIKDAGGTPRKLAVVS